MVKRELHLEDVWEVGRSTHVSDVKCVWAFVLKTIWEETLDDFRMNVKRIGNEDVNWVRLRYFKVQMRCYEHSIDPKGSTKFC
jgi:hypothetical protein